MAGTGPPVQKTKRGEKATAAATITWPLRATVSFIKLHHLLLSPLVVLSIPAEAMFQQNIPVAIAIGTVGLAGMILSESRAAIPASLSLLALLVWGKIASNILKTVPPDTAILLIEFVAVLVLMEASLVVLVFTEEYSILASRKDVLSESPRQHLQQWLRGRLSNLGKQGLTVAGLSIILLPVAGLTSIESNQIIFSATLALLAIVLLLFLVTHRREPEAG